MGTLAFTSIYFWHSGSDTLNIFQCAMKSAPRQTILPKGQQPHGEALNQSILTFLSFHSFSISLPQLPSNSSLQQVPYGRRGEMD